MTLSEIQKKLKAPKNQRNSFGNYNYRSCEDILEAVKPLLENFWLTITDEIVMVGTRYYVKATVTLHDGVTEGISVTAYAREEETKKGMDGSQITGAASSYARKYALNGLFLIDDTKDSDATNEHDKTPKEKVNEYAKEAKEIMENTITPDQIAILKEKKVKVSLIKEIIGRTTTKYSELTYDEAEKIITEVNERGKE